MIVRGVPFDVVVETVHKISADRYDGNVIVHQDARDLGTRKGGFAGRIAVADSHGEGARLSWTGRHMPAACWHAFRDVFAALFEQYPDASIRTGMALYKGADGFAENYPGTAYVNIGSMMQPVTMPELCDHPSWW